MGAEVNAKLISAHFASQHCGSVTTHMTSHLQILRGNIKKNTDILVNCTSYKMCLYSVHVRQELDVCDHCRYLKTQIFSQKELANCLGHISSTHYEKHDYIFQRELAKQFQVTQNIEYTKYYNLYHHHAYTAYKDRLSPELVDFAVGLVNFILHLPDRQAKVLGYYFFFEEVKLIHCTCGNSFWASKMISSQYILDTVKGKLENKISLYPDNQQMMMMMMMMMMMTTTTTMMILIPKITEWFKLQAMLNFLTSTELLIISLSVVFRFIYF